MTRIFCDLDGVLANFDGHFPAVFGCNHREMTKGEMWARINAHPTFFRDIPFFPGAREFFFAVNPAAILTSCPRVNFAEIARQKRASVREHIGDVTMTPCEGGHRKPFHMHAPGDILIDDHRPNITAWEANGGRGVLHRGFEGTLAALRGMM